MANVGINGFGRIGRLVLRAALEKGVNVCSYFLFKDFFPSYISRSSHHFGFILKFCHFAISSVGISCFN
jgi:hypothetical protein